MNKTMRQVFLTTILILLLLSACAPAPAPTTDPNLINGQIETSVVLTVQAMNTATAQAQPQPTGTLLPTATALDTPTAVPPLDTPTAIVLPTSTVASSGGGSSGGGGSSSSSEYSCTVINRKPADNTKYKPGDSFDIKWTIKNNGTKTLRAGLDLKYSNGDKLMPDTVVELPELKPGAETTFTFDAKAPSKNGTYIMAYMVEGGLCYPYTAIVVQK